MPCFPLHENYLGEQLSCDGLWASVITPTGTICPRRGSAVSWRVKRLRACRDLSMRPNLSGMARGDIGSWGPTRVSGPPRRRTTANSAVPRRLRVSSPTNCLDCAAVLATVPRRRPRLPHPPATAPPLGCRRRVSCRVRRGNSCCSITQLRCHFSVRHNVSFEPACRSRRIRPRVSPCGAPRPASRPTTTSLAQFLRFVAGRRPAKAKWIFSFNAARRDETVADAKADFDSRALDATVRLLDEGTRRIDRLFHGEDGRGTARNP